MEILGLLAFGFLLGMRHATDADHVVAVTAIAARHRRLLPAVLVGAIWGLGHSVTLCLVGGAILLFNLTVPARLGLSLELAVGFALAFVGALNVVGGPAIAKPAPGSPPAEPSRGQSARPFVLGVVHGLAGSAAVALFVLAAVRDPRLGLLYMGLFSLGTVAGMVLVTLGVALPARAISSRWPHLASPIRVATGLLSLAFGVFILYQVGFVDGLFGPAPRFDPH